MLLLVKNFGSNMQLLFVTVLQIGNVHFIFKWETSGNLARSLLNTQLIEIMIYQILKLRWQLIIYRF